MLSREGFHEFRTILREGIEIIRVDDHGANAAGKGAGCQHTKRIGQVNHKRTMIAGEDDEDSVGAACLIHGHHFAIGIGQQKIRSDVAGFESKSGINAHDQIRIQVSPRPSAEGFLNPSRCWACWT